MFSPDQRVLTPILLSSPPALYTLLEINKFYPEILKSGKCEVYIDGGIRRGTDVVKALCLGAKGVGMGRPFMYALTYGEDGVAHAIASQSAGTPTVGVWSKFGSHGFPV